METRTGSGSLLFIKSLTKREEIGTKYPLKLGLHKTFLSKKKEPEATDDASKKRKCKQEGNLDPKEHLGSQPRGDWFGERRSEEPIILEGERQQPPKKSLSRREQSLGGATSNRGRLSRLAAQRFSRKGFKREKQWVSRKKF
jgi:hypothetical protein